MKTRWLCVLRHNPQNPEILKSAIIFYICRYLNWIFSATTGLSSSFEISIERFYSCRGGSDWITINFILCIKLLIVQSFQKVVIKNDSYRLPKWCFSVTTVLISFMRVTISNLLLRKKFDSNFSHLVFWIKIWTLTRIDFFLICWLFFRYSISYFLVTRGLISSSKFSIENLKLLQ